MKFLLLSLILVSTSAFSALKWEPGSILNIRFSNVKHNLKIDDISYYKIDQSKLSEDDKEALKSATFQIEARFKICIDKEINGKVACDNLAIVPLSGAMDNRLLAENLGFMKTYDEVQDSIDAIMKKRGLTDKEDEKLKYYHFRLNFYKQSGKKSQASKLIFRKKIFPSKLGNGYQTSIKLHTESTKITGYGKGMIVNY